MLLETLSGAKPPDEGVRGAELLIEIVSLVGNDVFTKQFVFFIIIIVITFGGYI